MRYTLVSLALWGLIYAVLARRHGKEQAMPETDRESWVAVNVGDHFNHLLTYKEGNNQEAFTRETLWETYKEIQYVYTQNAPIPCFAAEVAVKWTDSDEDEQATLIGPFGLN